MSKLFSCIFPYSRSVVNPSTSEDVKNQAFLSNPNPNVSVCELSYHHVDSVANKVLQKRVEKLEAEKKALVEMMIYQHNDYKRRSSVVSHKIDGVHQKTSKKAGNFYTTINFEKTIRSLPQENIDDDSHLYMSID